MGVIYSRLVEFVRFAKEHVESGDIDPTYPLLKAVYKKRCYSKTEAIFHTLCYVAFYDLGSADAYAQTNAPNFLSDTTRLKKGIERRGFRGNDNARVFLRAATDQIARWIPSYDAAPNGEEAWKMLRETFEELPFAGPWSSYKFADLLTNVHDAPITAPDIGIGGGGETAGPVPGLVYLTGLPWKEAARDIALQRQVYDYARTAGAPFKGLEQFETSLCDFNSFKKGRYYVGHDIDSQMEQIKNLGATYWEARQEIFPKRYLGELNGWFGVRKEKMCRGK